MFRFFCLFIVVFFVGNSIAAEVIKVQVSENAVVKMKETQGVQVGANNNSYKYSDTTIYDTPTLDILYNKWRET